VLNWFRDLFSESSDVSMTRFLSFLCVVSAVGIGVIGVYKGSDLSATAVLCGTFLGFGFGAKVSQRFIESKESSGVES
jgi:hypothetical protein